MDSLKNYSERLATCLDLTPAALYERQRQLVRLGLITPPAKTGPGAGVRATPDNVAMLLLSCMASDSLAEIATRIVKIARLRYHVPVQSPGARAGDRQTDRSFRCPLTKAANFGSALKAILSDPVIAARVSGVHLLRSFSADINFEADEGLQISQFGAPDSIFEVGMAVTANVYGKFLQQVANDLHQKE